MPVFDRPEGLFRQSVRFSAEDGDPRGQVRPDAILTRFQDIAGAHYDSLGLGRDTAVTHGCFWALIRTDLRCIAPPPKDEDLWLDTWAGRWGHGLFWRHYRLFDREGQVLLRAVSSWVLMDLETRVLSRDHVWAQTAVRPKMEDSLPERFRGEPFPDVLPDVSRRIVTKAETDINGHLNNALYIPWATDLLPGGFEERRRLRRLWIEYRKELPEGQEAELRSLLENDILYVSGSAEGRESFQVRLEYDPI